MTLESKCIIIAGEEAGPRSNKMGGIWNVIDAEAKSLASLISKGIIDKETAPSIIVAGPYYGHSGSDWNKGLNRITDMSAFEEMEPEGEFFETMEELKRRGIESFVGIEMIKGVKVIHLMFKTDDFCRVSREYKGQEMCLASMIKAEAFDLIGLDSMTYESMGNGMEYSHYLNLSYALSEFIRALVTAREKSSEEYHDQAISEFAASLMPAVHVSLHCHEFGVFYALARLKKLGISVKTVATYHATLPGRSSGHYSIQKIRDNDSSWDSGVPINHAKLESLSAYADVVTAVGDSTRKEIKLFYGIDSIIVRNGIDKEDEEIDWDKKNASRKKIQEFLSEKIYNVFDSKVIPPDRIIPIFSISRIEIENKGYPDLLDSLLILDRMVKTEIDAGHLDENYRVICFIIAAQGPKTNLPENFPVNLPEEVLVGEEIRLQQMIQSRGLGCSKIPDGTRHVSAVLYPQWISDHDGGLNMNPDEFMAGCIAGVFPSKYEPFLLTGLEAGKESTPSIVSKVCGFSDALKTLKRLVMGMGGVIVVDNISIPYLESIADYALAMDYFIDTFTDDKVKYNLLCQEANLLARDMNWEEPIKTYYELLTGTILE
ncbi:glycosyltransferase [Methanolobus profundi]|uniref:Glycosyltransferase involved in cell wall bisynthesis n=1 Tax=Methanolobus profundi TaxID=487685 RepID=A0A1I4RYS1_9EURY|nr:glycosyltransferase [Methanolobus profundi]SFM57456.1 Glycosyltransferase involved in cell wall bisynthesis [Methanolobus profundi]